MAVAAQAVEVERGADGPVRDAGGIERLGGVLGNVVGHGLHRQRAAGAGQLVAVADRPGVGLGAEPEHDRQLAASRFSGDGRGGGGLADGLAQHRGGERRGGWLPGLAGGVEADDGVEVHDAACLVFGDLDVADGELAAQLRGSERGEAGEVAGQVGGEAAPQVGGVRVEQDRRVVVVAVAAQRAAEPRIVRVVAAGAGDVAAVRAAAGVWVAAGAAGQHGLAAHPAGVHRPERGGGEGGEHARMLRDGLRDVLAAHEPGPDELAGVALVDGRAGRADGLAAVAARGEQHAAGLGAGVVDRGELAGGQVDRVDPALQADRVGTAAGGGVLVGGGEEVGPGDGGVVGGCPDPRAVVWSGDEGNRRGGAYGGPPQRCWIPWPRSWAA